MTEQYQVKIQRIISDNDMNWNYGITRFVLCNRATPDLEIDSVQFETRQIAGRVRQIARKFAKTCKGNIERGRYI